MKKPARASSAAALLLMGVVSGCTIFGDQSEATESTRAVDETPQSYLPTDDVIVTRDSGDLPPRCGPRDVAGLITNFFDAFNRGEREAVNPFIAPDGDFGWYSMTEGDPANGGRHFVTEDRNRAVLLLRGAPRTGRTTKVALRRRRC